MKYYLDTEFIEDGKTIDLISIGIVCEDGREFYAINLQCDWEKASEWVWDNVLIPMGVEPYRERSNGGLRPIDPDTWKSRRDIVSEIIRFFGIEIVNDSPTQADPPTLIPGQWHFEVPTDKPKPEFYAYYADYDWVVFCQLFGTMMDLPKGFPMYCKDLMQECDRLGFDPQSVPQCKEHNALEDARWNKRLHDKLIDFADDYDLKLGIVAAYEEMEFDSDTRFAS